MTEHLSEEQVSRYREKQIPPEELIGADDHIAGCAVCRARLASSADLIRAFARPRYGAFAVGIESEGVHLTYEQTEAYVDGKLDDATCEEVRAHVADCSTCAEELRDLEAFKNELAGAQTRDIVMGKRPWTALFRPWLTLSRVSAALAVAVLVVAVVLLPRRWHLAGPTSPSERGHPPVETTIARWPGIESLPTDEQRRVLSAIANQDISPPPILAQLAGKQGTLLSESQSTSGFRVVEPVGEVVLDPRPVFRWRALAGSENYIVAISDAQLNMVQSSPFSSGTRWRPNRPLERGKVYTWQVKAIRSEEAPVISPAPPAPEAKFQVLDQATAEKLERFRQANPDAHVILGILYVQAALLSEGEQEFRRVPVSDPSYRLAQKLLETVGRMRSPKL